MKFNDSSIEKQYIHVYTSKFSNIIKLSTEALNNYHTELQLFLDACF